MAAVPRQKFVKFWQPPFKPEMRVRLGEALAALGRELGLTNEDFEVLDQMDDKMSAKPLKFE